MREKPFPTTQSGISLLLKILQENLTAFAVILGILPAEVTRISDDADNYGYMITAAALVEESRDAFYAYKGIIIDAAPGTPAPGVPVLPVIAMPAAVTPGIVPNLRLTIKRIKASAGFNDVIGEALGLLESGTGEIPGGPESLTASLTVAAKPSGRVEIAFSKQGQSGMRAEFKRKSETVWGLAGDYTKSPANHIAPSVPPDEPESRQYRGILMSNNEPVGNYSPIYTVVTTP